MAVVFYVLYLQSRRQVERERDFVAMVTHELRTPLAAMYSASENLSHGVVTDPGRVRTYGEALLTEARRLRTMIDKTLRYAGLHGNRGLDTQPVALEELVATAAARPAVDPTRLELASEDNLPPARGDRDALDSLIANLVDNAFVHNPPETVVRVSLARSDGPSGTRRRDRGSAWIVVSVSDNGSGIAKADLRHVSEPFFRGSSSRALQRPGSGLGLSIARRIVELHGGRLQLESEEGRGTDVTVYLPMWSDD
jgi:two-component system OmpR family sensor kinase